MSRYPKVSHPYQIKSSWVIHHKYQVMEASTGKSYLVPGEGDFFKTYDPFELSDALIVDALNLGDRYKAYMERKHIWDGIDDALQRELRPYLQDYYKHFLKVWKSLESEMLMFAEKYGIIGSKSIEGTYAFFAFMVDHYDTHNSACYAVNDDRAVNDDVSMWIKDFHLSSCEISIDLASDRMIWRFPDLESMIRVIYMRQLSAKDSYLKRCAHCKGFFVAKTARERFCSGVCRNRYNVYGHRRRRQIEVIPE